MRIVILCSNDIFASSLLYPLLNNDSHHIVGIFQQADVMRTGKSPYEMFRYVQDISGWQYALYQSLQVKGYETLLRLRGNIQLPRAMAQHNHIPYEVIKNVHASDSLEKIKALKPDIVFLIRFSQIIKKPLLEIPSIGVFNFHASMLPHYRGLGSVFQALTRKEEYLGYTVHQVDESIDTGVHVIQGRFKTLPEESASRHYMTLHLNGGALIVQALDMIASGEWSPDKPPSEYELEEGSYFSFPDKEDVRLFLKRGGQLINPRDFFWVWNSFHPEKDA